MELPIGLLLLVGEELITAAHNRPDKTSRSTISSTTPNPPLGRYPQLRLWDHVGNTPASRSTNTTSSTIPIALLHVWLQTRSQGAAVPYIAPAPERAWKTPLDFMALTLVHAIAAAY